MKVVTVLSVIALLAAAWQWGEGAWVRRRNIEAAQRARRDLEITAWSENAAFDVVAVQCRREKDRQIRRSGERLGVAGVLRLAEYPIDWK